LIIAIVGTTVAPWQLFFQQSYVVDKRTAPRFIKYEASTYGLALPNATASRSILALASQ
jgi:Mn2+/Fe2+ NRAMP family transporter